MKVQILKYRSENWRLEESIRPFVSSRLSKQEIRRTEQHRDVSGLFLSVFIFLSVYELLDLLMNLGSEND